MSEVGCKAGKGGSARHVRGPPVRRLQLSIAGTGMLQAVDGEAAGVRREEERRARERGGAEGRRQVRLRVCDTGAHRLLATCSPLRMATTSCVSFTCWRTRLPDLLRRAR